MSNQPWRNPVTLARAYEKYGSAEGIAEAWGCSDRTIRTWLHKHDSIQVNRQGRKGGWETTDPPNHVLEDAEGYEIVETFDPVVDAYGAIVDRERKAVRIHRLVAVAYWGWDNVVGKEVHHRNGCKIDNRPENLIPLKDTLHGGLPTAWRQKYADGEGVDPEDV